MDFSLSENELLVQETAQRFAKSHLSAFKKNSPEEAKNEQPLFQSSLTKLAQLGFMGISVRSEFGGTEAGAVAYSLAITELAKECPSTALTVSVTNMVAEVLQSVGTPEQQHSFIPRLCSGEYMAGSFCLTESQAGSDPAAMKTTASYVTDRWILNGSKQWITSATFAGIFLVWAVTDSSASRGKGITCFLVDPLSRGVTVGAPQKKMGQHHSPTCDVFFDNVELSDTSVLGEVNGGYSIAVKELTGGRIGIASLALGIGYAAMNYASAYTLQRKQFKTSISDFQGIQWIIADRFTELEAAQLLILRAADLKNRKLPFTKEASMAKLFASEKTNIACYSALQLLGGYGYMQDYPIEAMARDARITTIYEGTSEIQRIIIAKNILAEIRQKVSIFTHPNSKNQNKKG
jgi:alkylation response protein AidB-like acyl-CoA dehydrogenase